MTNFCNKIPLYFQDVEVQVAPWNTTKAYMLAMKVSLTKKKQIMDKCQFGCGILKMVGPKMQVFCPRINMLKGFFLQSCDELWFVKKCKNSIDKLSKHKN